MENIMLQDENKQWIKIIDFGLSNAYNEENPLKTLCGSPEYAAPELFVKGKKYGPEVDLWSFGVILYVMGTGRLPFTSPRDESSSADERRRRLMVQINRGLSAPQERLIVTLSNDYKNLLRLALMPVAHKRIRLGELRRHPWMSDASSTNYTNEKLQLSLVERETIVREISARVGIDYREIEMDIINRRFGNIGGIYNIMSHKIQLEKLRCSLTEVPLVNPPQTTKHNFEKLSHEPSKKIKVSRNSPTANSDHMSNKSVKEITRPAFIQTKTFNSRRINVDPICDPQKTKKKSPKSTMLPCPKKITHPVTTQIPNNKIHSTKEHLLQKQRKATVDPIKFVKFCRLQTKHKVDNNDDTRQRNTCFVKKYSTFRLGKNTTGKKSNTSEPKSVIPKLHNRVTRLLTKVSVSDEK